MGKATCKRCKGKGFKDTPVTYMKVPGLCFDCHGKGFLWTGADLTRIELAEERKSLACIVEEGQRFNWAFGVAVRNHFFSDLFHAAKQTPKRNARNAETDAKLNAYWRNKLTSEEFTARRARIHKDEQDRLAEKLQKICDDRDKLRGKYREKIAEVRRLEKKLARGA